MQKVREVCGWMARAAACIAFALSLGACQSPGVAGRSAPGGIVQLNVMTVPVALDFDGIPGPDGIAVKLYANDARHPKAVRLRDGVLEILMFDGTFFGRTNVPPALRTFRFTVPELRAHEFTSEIGAGYDFSLFWSTNRPTQRIMTVAARYTAPDGAIITSRPSSVTVLEK